MLVDLLILGFVSIASYGTRGNSRKALEIFLFGLTSACFFLSLALARGC